MSIRWLQGARQLDTSRGSRFMREDAERPVERGNSLERGTSDVAPQQRHYQRLDEAIDVKPGARPRQVRAMLRQSDPRRNAR